MANGTEREAPAADASGISAAANLLGGSRVFHRRLSDPLEVHEVLSRGLPREALTHLISKVAVLHDHTLLKLAIGVSLRTSQRMKAASGKPLSPEQSGRAWKFAEVIAKATEVLGSQQEAEDWLQRPAIALDQRRPIDLLASPAGVKLVEDLLVRIEYGVYT